MRITINLVDDEIARAIGHGEEVVDELERERLWLKTLSIGCDRVGGVGDRLDVQDIPPEITQRRQLIAGSGAVAGLGAVSLDELEKQAIEETLAKTKGNREKTAKILGIGERTLYRKIKDYNLNK